MPLDPGLAEQEKGQRCAAYDDAERASRMATGSYAFYIPPRITDDWFRRSLVVIDRLESVTEWEQHILTDPCSGDTRAAFKMDPAQSRYGTFSLVYWQPRLGTWKEAEETPPPAMSTAGRTRSSFSLSLWDESSRTVSGPSITTMLMMDALKGKSKLY